MEGASVGMVSAKNKLFSAFNIRCSRVAVEITDCALGRGEMKAFTPGTIEYMHHAVCAVVRDFMIKVDRFYIVQGCQL